MLVVGAVLLGVLVVGACAVAWMFLRASNAPPQQAVIVPPAPSQKVTGKPWTGSRSPLMRAVGKSTYEVSQFIAEGYDVNEQAKDGGGAPLHMAAYQPGDRCLKTAELLVESGANVNASIYGSGLTPLMLAAANNCEKLSIYLLSKGAKVNATDRQGRTALDFAEYHKHETIVTSLKQAGAMPGTGVHVDPRKTRVNKATTLQSLPVELETTAESVSLAGKWQMQGGGSVHPAQLIFNGENRYTMQAGITTGEYELRGDSLVMVKANISSYADTVSVLAIWKVRPDGSLVLSNTRFAGLTLTRDDSAGTRSESPTEATTNPASH
jgi:hypothetical protein